MAQGPHSRFFRQCGPGHQFQLGTDNLIDVLELQLIAILTLDHHILQVEDFHVLRDDALAHHRLHATGHGWHKGLGIGGKVKVGDEKGDIFGDEGGLKRSDLGVRLGAGVVWKRIYFGLGYDIGCLNLVKESDGEGTMRNNCFTISVGYNF